MKTNTQIFLQRDYEPERIGNSLIGCVTSDISDFTEGPFSDSKVWKDNVIIEVFSSLIAEHPLLASGSDAYFSILHYDGFGRPVTVEEWRFDELAEYSFSLLRHVLLTNGMQFHCVAAKPFDGRQLRIFIDRTNLHKEQP